MTSPSTNQSRPCSDAAKRPFLHVKFAKSLMDRPLKVAKIEDRHSQMKRSIAAGKIQVRDVILNLNSRRTVRLQTRLKHTHTLPRAVGCFRSTNNATNLCSVFVGFQKSTYVKKTFLAALS